MSAASIGIQGRWRLAFGDEDMLRYGSEGLGKKKCDLSQAFGLNGQGKHWYHEQRWGTPGEGLI